MKRKLLITGLTLLALSTLNSQLSTAFAQGSLTPPGAPAPTMKSADQIYSKLDPRTPISSAFNITNPGSYYLTTNLAVSYGSAIGISTSDVTLDLNGFTISCDPSAPPGLGGGGFGVFIGGLSSIPPSLHDITIVNGHITGSFPNAGITHSCYSLTNVLVSKVSVSGAGEGIIFSTTEVPGALQPVSTMVENCTVTAGYYGINASTIKDSDANVCVYDAILGDQVTDCRGICTGGANGINASATAQNCYGQSSSGTGLQARIAIGCIGSSTSGVGLQATIATSCIVAHGTANITYKYNMP